MRTMELFNGKNGYADVKICLDIMRKLAIVLKRDDIKAEYLATVKSINTKVKQSLDFI